ncbi:MAG: hypothetical protein K9M57_01860 [Phycisphaerae bacterium]|nr:hypothetical protein [Phycisphaerae bacterium]
MNGSERNYHTKPSDQEKPTFMPAQNTPIKHRIADLSDELNDIYAECSEKNWDGYGAKPVHKSIRKIVEIFLNKLPEDIPNPELSPDPDGEISLEWCIAKKKMASISIGKQGRIAYAFLNEEKRSSGLDLFENKIPESFLFQLKTLYP